MGHLNVRFHAARAMQGLAGMAAALGMPSAFSPNAPASLAVRGHHIRFLREARAGAPLHMTAGVIAMGESDATLLQTLIHSRSGETASTFVTRVTHVSARDGRSFPWPQRARDAAEERLVTAPPEAGPRSLAEDGPDAADAGEASRFSPVARGAVSPQDCDVFGRMRTEMVLGWLSQGIPQLVEPFRLEAQAALEYRISYFGAPGPGDLLELRSGAVAAEPKVMRLRHWLVDPRSGVAWAAAENMSLQFDLDTRKSLVLPAEALTRLRAQLIAL